MIFFIIFLMSVCKSLNNSVDYFCEVWVRYEILAVANIKNLECETLAGTC